MQSLSRSPDIHALQSSMRNPRDLQGFYAACIKCYETLVTDNGT